MDGKGKMSIRINKYRKKSLRNRKYNSDLIRPLKNFGVILKKYKYTEKLCSLFSSDHLLLFYWYWS